MLFREGGCVSWAEMFSGAFKRKTCRCHFSLLLFVQPVHVLYTSIASVSFLSSSENNNLISYAWAEAELLWKC